MFGAASPLFGASPLPNRAMAEDIISDLEDTGLYEFANSVGLLNDIQGGQGIVAGSPFVPSLHSLSPAYQEQRYRGPPGAGAPGTSGVVVHQQASAVMINTTADATAAAAAQVVASTKRKLAEMSAMSQPSSSMLASPDSASGKSRRQKARPAPSEPPSASGGRGGNKGLRHFSMKVCEKVEGKGRTTYNEVADELVTELSALGGGEEGDEPAQYDEKNIRRRVYDAINVLMAMDIIGKEKKDIVWKGFPCLNTTRAAAGGAVAAAGPSGAAAAAAGGGGGGAAAALPRAQLSAEVSARQRYLQDLIHQQQALRALLDRNANHPGGGGGGGGEAPATALHLPFILVVSKPDAVVDVQISESMMDVQFDFYNSQFDIHDDSVVLRLMGAQQQQQAAAAALRHAQQQQAEADAAAARLYLEGGSGRGGGGGGGLPRAVAAAAMSDGVLLPTSPAVHLPSQPARRTPRTAPRVH